MQGIVPAQIGPIQHPIPHGDVPYPSLKNLVDKGYADFNFLRNRIKTFRVPDGVVDTAPTLIEFPEPFLHGSVLYFRNSVLEPMDSIVELNNLEVLIPQAPETGANRELLVFRYLPAYFVGNNASKKMLTFTFTADRVLSAPMVWYSNIRVLTTSGAVELTLPSDPPIGSRVTFFRDGDFDVILTPPVGTTIDSFAGSYLIGTNLEGIELIYSVFNTTKRWNIIGREGY